MCVRAGEKYSVAMWRKGKTRVNGDTTEINPSPTRSRSVGFRSYLIIGSPCCPAARLSLSRIYLLFSDESRPGRRRRKRECEREIEMEMGTEGEFTVVVCFCPNRSGLVDTRPGSVIAC